MNNTASKKRSATGGSFGFGSYSLSGKDPKRHRRQGSGGENNSFVVQQERDGHNHDSIGPLPLLDFQARDSFLVRRNDDAINSHLPPICPIDASYDQVGSNSDNAPFHHCATSVGDEPLDSLRIILEESLSQQLLCGLPLIDGECIVDDELSQPSPTNSTDIDLPIVSELRAHLRLEECIQMMMTTAMRHANTISDQMTYLEARVIVHELVSTIHHLLPNNLVDMVQSFDIVKGVEAGAYLAKITKELKGGSFKHWIKVGESGDLNSRTSKERQPDIKKRYLLKTQSQIRESGLVPEETVDRLMQLDLKLFKGHDASRAERTYNKIERQLFESICHASYGIPINPVLEAVLQTPSSKLRALSDTSAMRKYLQRHKQFAAVKDMFFGCNNMMDFDTWTTARSDFEKNDDYISHLITGQRGQNVTQYWCQENVDPELYASFEDMCSCPLFARIDPLINAMLDGIVSYQYQLTHIVSGDKRHLELGTPITVLGRALWTEQARQKNCRQKSQRSSEVTELKQQHEAGKITLDGDDLKAVQARQQKSQRTTEVTKLKQQHEAGKITLEGDDLKAVQARQEANSRSKEVTRLRKLYVAGKITLKGQDLKDVMARLKKNEKAVNRYKCNSL